MRMASSVLGALCLPRRIVLQRPPPASKPTPPNKDAMMLTLTHVGARLQPTLVLSHKQAQPVRCASVRGHAPKLSNAASQSHASCRRRALPWGSGRRRPPLAAC